MSSVVNLVKQSSLLYNVYYYIGNVFIRVLKLFVRPDSKLIVFNSFGGRKYDDSPKAIYIRMLEDSRFNDFKFVWAFIDPSKFSIPKGVVVKVDSLKYYIAVLRARVWITNTTMTRALSFEGINTFSLNTWHGSAIKKIGRDAAGDSTFVSKGRSGSDVYLAQGEYDRAIFSRAFGITPERIKVIGLPRNDELADESAQIKKQIIQKSLSIPPGKIVILYAPTFREYVKEGADCVLRIPINWESWEMALGDKYVLLMRAHHAVVKSLDIKENSFIKDVSSYPYLNDLMIASDMLISDYSSIFFDYAILGRPMFCFAYDYDKYNEERGLYFDIRKELGDDDITTEEKLLSAIVGMDLTKRVEIAKSFRNKYVQRYGNAALDSLNLISNAIQ